MFPEDNGFTAGSPDWQEECDAVIARYCNRCPVRQDCLAFALSPEEREASRGIWGAVDFLARRKINDPTRRTA